MAEIKADVRRNRRWNYFIIRELWKICGNQSPDLYARLEISKRRYTNLITGDTYSTPRINERAKELHKLIGADTIIFTGDAFLTVPGFSADEVKKHLGPSAPGHSDEKDLSDQIDEKDTEEFLKKVRERLKNLNSRECSDNLYKILYFAKKQERYDGNINIDYIMKACKKIGIKDIETAYDNGTLKEYMAVLREQLKMATAVETYKKYID